MQKQNKLAAELVSGDRLIAASDGLTHVVDRVFWDGNETFVLFKEPTRSWARYANRLCVQVVEHWETWDEDFPSELSREFGQGWEFSKDFLLPLWADACRCLSDELELGVPIPNDDVLRELIKRRITYGLKLMMFGSNGIDEATMDKLELHGL